MTTVEELIEAPQYSLSVADKRRVFVPLLREAFVRNAELCPPFAHFLEGYRFEPGAANELRDFPVLPVGVFKTHKLTTVPEHEVVRELRSSSTTGQSPSRIFLDKATLHRQTRGLASVLKSHIGNKRRPYLVLDVPDATSAQNAHLGARGAAIRGFENFASSTVYALRSEGNEYKIDWKAVDDFCAAHGQGEVLVFGFTFVIWSVICKQLREQNRRLSLPLAKVFHGGGWKKLQSQSVSKPVFNDGVAEVLGCQSQAVLDYYGMVEQVGSIFIDCEHGNKHAPNFSAVLIIDPLTLEPVGPGKTGLIEVVSLLPTSYPGQVLITEDVGRVVAVDDCPCGRRDVAFQFVSRVERAEVRGCGDTLAR